MAKLKALLGDKEPTVVVAAAHSLFLLGDREDAYKIDYDILTGDRKAADGFMASEKKELTSPIDVTLIGIEVALGLLPGGDAGFDIFMDAIKDGRTPVRVAAALELAADRDPKISEVLARACGDKNRHIRAAAIDAIAMIDNPALLSAITPSLDDKSDNGEV